MDPEARPPVESAAAPQRLISSSSSSSMPSPFSISASQFRVSTVEELAHMAAHRERDIHATDRAPNQAAFPESTHPLRVVHSKSRPAHTSPQVGQSSDHQTNHAPGHLRRYLPSSNTNRPGIARSQSVLEPVNRVSPDTRPEKIIQEMAATWPRVAITMHDGVVFLLGDVLGRGQFGTVYRAIDAATGRIVAVKRIPVLDKPKLELDHMMREVRLLRSLVSPFVVKYEGYCTDDAYVSIVMEYVENGSLQHTIRTFGCFNEELSAGYTVKILQGLIYLHLMDVVHCDVKCANVLTTKRGDVKLSDFGISLNLAGQSTMKGIGVSGTPNWLAPEVISMRGTTKASDIWALGCTILEMVTGKPPYNGQNAMNTMYSIVEDRHPPLPTSISSQLRNFLLLCFNKEPRARPTAQELMHHPWIAQFWQPKPTVNRAQDQGPVSLATSEQASEVKTSTTEDACVKWEPEVKTCEPLAGAISVPKSEQSEVKAQARPTSAPLHLTAEQKQDLSTRQWPHTAVMIFHLHQVQCSVCGGNVRKALHCQRCNVLAHAKCLAASGISCIASDEAPLDDLHVEKVPSQWLKRRSALSGLPSVPDHFDKIALLPEQQTGRPLTRYSSDEKRQGCKMM